MPRILDLDWVEGMVVDDEQGIVLLTRGGGTFSIPYTPGTNVLGKSIGNKTAVLRKGKKHRVEMVTTDGTVYGSSPGMDRPVKIS